MSNWLDVLIEQQKNDGSLILKSNLTNILYNFSDNSKVPSIENFIYDVAEVLDCNTFHTIYYSLKDAFCCNVLDTLYWTLDHG